MRLNTSTPHGSCARVVAKIGRLPDGARPPYGQPGGRSAVLDGGGIL